MADNVTTVLGLDPAGALSLADVLYIIQGTAEDRDRYLTLEKLRDFIQVNWDGAKITMENTTIVAEDDYFKVTGIGGNTKMDGGNIVVTATGGSATLSNDELSFTDGTNTSSYGASAAKVGNVTVSKTGVTVSGSGGSSTLENGKLSFVGSGTSSSFSASGLSIVYGGMTLTAINDSTGTYFGISGTGGGTRIYQDSITITGNGMTTTIGAGTVETVNVSATGTIEATGNAGHVKGLIQSKWYGFANKTDKTTLDNRMLNTAYFTTGTLYPVMGPIDEESGYFNYYGPDGEIHSVQVYKNFGAILLCVGVCTVGTTDYPTFVCINSYPMPAVS